MKTRAKKTPDRYLELVKVFPLRPIRTEKEHDAAIDMYKGLLFQDHPLNQDEKDYIEAILLLVKDYEEKHQKIDRGKKDPGELVRHLMDENNLTISGLAKAIGIGQPNLSEMLSGKRTWSKTAIKGLCARFSLNPSRFL